jgi:hypothetical protein
MLSVDFNVVFDLSGNTLQRPGPFLMVKFEMIVVTIIICS